MKKYRSLLQEIRLKKLVVLALSLFVLSGTNSLAQGKSTEDLKQTDVISNALKKGGCDGFEGKWDGGSYGIMTLTQQGNQVNGTYEWKGTQSISGTVQGGVLTGTFEQPNYPEDKFKRGSIKFTLAKDGKSWSGTWTDRDGNYAGTWSGRCISND